jgi:hypothetical protein
MAKNNETISTAAKLLRGEISAVETFQQAIHKFRGDAEAPLLGRIGLQHIAAVDILKKGILDAGGEPDEGSGIWGAFAKAVEGTAKVFGESAALAALIQGEEIGISDYESALEDEGVSESLKSTIRSTLLPQLNENVAALKLLRA